MIFRAGLAALINLEPDIEVVLGYILKSTPFQQLATTIRSLNRGSGQLDPAIALKHKTLPIHLLKSRTPLH